jgi:hypothetical protein
MSYEVPEAIVRERRVTCDQCPLMKRWPLFDQCTECGCDIDDKTRSADPEKFCPKRYWKR